MQNSRKFTFLSHHKISSWQRLTIKTKTVNTLTINSTKSTKKRTFKRPGYPWSRFSFVDIFYEFKTFSEHILQKKRYNVDMGMLTLHTFIFLWMERQRIMACHERCKITRILKGKCKYVHIVDTLTNTQGYNTRKHNSNKFLDTINFSCQKSHKYFIFETSSSFSLCRQFFHFFESFNIPLALCLKFDFKNTNFLLYFYRRFHWYLSNLKKFLAGIQKAIHRYIRHTV